jgi:hypothetical protein
MYCSKCGKGISDDSKFCYSCGSTIEKQASINDTPSKNIKPSQDKQEIKKEITFNKETGELEIPEGIPTFSLNKLTKLKQRRKWGWGWILVLMSYTSYYSQHPVKINNGLIEAFISLGGYVSILVCYFWIRNYVGRYTDSLYKPAIISGFASIFIIGIIIQLLEVFLGR